MMRAVWNGHKISSLSKNPHLSHQRLYLGVLKDGISFLDTWGTWACSVKYIEGIWRWWELFQMGTK